MISRPRRSKNAVLCRGTSALSFSLGETAMRCLPSTDIKQRSNARWWSVQRQRSLRGFASQSPTNVDQRPQPHQSRKGRPESSPAWSAAECRVNIIGAIKVPKGRLSLRIPCLTAACFFREPLKVMFQRPLERLKLLRHRDLPSLQVQSPLTFNNDHSLPVPQGTA